MLRSFFCNAGHLAEQIHKNIAKSETPIREVLLSAHQINQLDSTGADQFERLQKDLAGKQIGISLAETKAPLRESMRRTGLENTIGVDRFYESIADGVQAFLERQEHSIAEPRQSESSSDRDS